MLSIQDKQEIADAIKQIESRSSGEIVAVIAAQSGQYLFTSLLWAAFIGLPIPLLLSMIPSLHPILNDGSVSLLVQAASVMLLFLLCSNTSLAVWLTPKAVTMKKASRLAQQQFFQQGLYQTNDRAAILLFVSVAERYVEIIADKGLNDLVDPETWPQLIAGFREKVKQGETTLAFIDTIHRCYQLLATHFPADGRENINELSDILVEIE